VLGTVIGAATFGTLLGPLLGTIAVAVGTRPVFVAVGAIAFGLAAWTRTHPDPGACDAVAPPPGAIRAALRSGTLGLGTWLITLEAITFGATNALLPLRLSQFGASGFAIGATFVLASAVSTVLSPIVGRVTDRRGARRPLTWGLAGGAVLLASLAFPQSALLLAVLSVIALGVPLTAYAIPAVSMMTTSAERAGVALVLVTTLINLAYAAGETIGAPAAAGLAQATSDTVPILLVAAMMLVSVRAVLRRTPGTDASAAVPHSGAAWPADERTAA
jgi:MFS family permease